MVIVVSLQKKSSQKNLLTSIPFHPFHPKRNKQTEIVAECLKKGAQLDAVEDEGGWSALMWAAINGKIDLMELLIKKGASVHLKDHVGKTVAEYAGKMGNHASVMEELFKCNKTLIKAAELRQSVKVGGFFSSTGL